MSQRKQARYHILIANRPGELAKLTKYLAEKGVSLSALRVAQVGDKASVEFAVPQEISLPERFKATLIPTPAGDAVENIPAWSPADPG